MADRDEYTWESLYPSFCPAADPSMPGTYYIQISLTCYPYMRSGDFQPEAFPPSLLRLGLEGNTRFVLALNDEDGSVYEGMGWEEACDEADRLNRQFDDVVKACSESFRWDCLPFDLDPRHLIWCK